MEDHCEEIRQVMGTNTYIFVFWSRDMDYHYQEIELHNLTGEKKAACIDFIQKSHDAYFFNELKRSQEHISADISIQPSSTHFKRDILVWDNDMVIAKGEFMYRTGEKETNSDLCEIFIEVDPNYTRKGIGKGILTRFVELADEYNKTKLEIWTNNYASDGRVMELIKKLGLKHVVEEKCNRLLRENINHKVLEEKLPVLKEKLGHYQLMKMTRQNYLKKILEDISFRTQLADFHTEVMNLIPKEGSERNDTIFTSNDMMERAKTAILHPSSGAILLLLDGETIIGFSETKYPNHDVRGVNTGLTGVRKKYQRRGIALYLKLLMVEHYLGYDEFHQIDTENAQSNAGMIKINEEIGFRHVFSWMGYEGEITEIKRRLGTSLP